MPVTACRISMNIRLTQLVGSSAKEPSDRRLLPGEVPTALLIGLHGRQVLVELHYFRLAASGLDQEQRPVCQIVVRVCVTFVGRPTIICGSRRHPTALCR